MIHGPTSRRKAGPVVRAAGAGVPFVLACLGFLAWTSAAVFAQRDAEVYGTFGGNPMYTVLPPGAIPAISDPEFLRGQDAADQMSPHEPVIGMVIDGKARAYSMWQLDSHEIVNDVLGGVAIAATW